MRLWQNVYRLLPWLQGGVLYNDGAVQMFAALCGKENAGLRQHGCNAVVYGGGRLHTAGLADAAAHDLAGGCLLYTSIVLERYDSHVPMGDERGVYTAPAVRRWIAELARENEGFVVLHELKNSSPVLPALRRQMEFLWKENKEVL